MHVVFTFPTILYFKQLEFDYSARRKTGMKMIPVVMEEAVRNTRAWRGPVGMILGCRWYSFDIGIYPIVLMILVTL